MPDQEGFLADELNLEYFVVSLQLDGLRFVDCYEYWARDCNFEGHMDTNSRLTKTLVGWHHVEVFALPPRSRPVFYMSVWGCGVSW